MLHRKFKLIHNPDTIFIDRNRPQESDIDEEDNPISQATLKTLENSKKIGVTSLLSAVNLKGRRELPRELVLKREAIPINDENEDDWLQNGNESESESESLVFIKKKTSPDCLKKKLRRLALVPNKLKLEGRD